MYADGKPHRLNGLVVVRADGIHSWYRNGIRMTEEVNRHDRG
jgi:hypothetical protein